MSDQTNLNVVLRELAERLDRVEAAIQTARPAMTFRELVAKVGPQVATVTASAEEPPDYGPGRCEICGWTLKTDPKDGCVSGNCSYRPDIGSPEGIRIGERRAALTRSARVSAEPPPTFCREGLDGCQNEACAAAKPKTAGELFFALPAAKRAAFMDAFEAAIDRTQEAADARPERAGTNDSTAAERRDAAGDSLQYSGPMCERCAAAGCGEQSSGPCLALKADILAAVAAAQPRAAAFAPRPVSREVLDMQLDAKAEQPAPTRETMHCLTCGGPCDGPCEEGDEQFEREHAAQAATDDSHAFECPRCKAAPGAACTFGGWPRMPPHPERPRRDAKAAPDGGRLSERMRRSTTGAGNPIPGREGTANEVAVLEAMLAAAERDNETLSAGYHAAMGGWGGAAEDRDAARADLSRFGFDVLDLVLAAEDEILDATRAIENIHGTCPLDVHECDRCRVLGKAEAVMRELQKRIASMRPMP